MDDYVRIYRIVPLPDIEAEAFEAFVQENVVPAVDTGPTRGGQISHSSFLKDVSSERQDRFLWLVYWHGTNAGWVDGQLEEALKQLQSVGIPLSSTVMTALA